MKEVYVSHNRMRFGIGIRVYKTARALERRARVLAEEMNLSPKRLTRRALGCVLFDSNARRGGGRWFRFEMLFQQREFERDDSLIWHEALHAAERVADMLTHAPFNIKPAACCSKTRHSRALWKEELVAYTQEDFAALLITWRDSGYQATDALPLVHAYDTFRDKNLITG